MKLRASLNYGKTSLQFFSSSGDENAISVRKEYERDNTDIYMRGFPPLPLVKDDR